MVGSIMVDITKLAVCHGDVSVGMKSLASVAEMDFEVFFSSMVGAGWARPKIYGAGPIIVESCLIFSSWPS